MRGGAAAQVRFPGLTIVAALVLYAGTSHSAAWLAFHHGTGHVGAGHVIVGWAGLLIVTLGCPAALWARVLRYVTSRC
eukprot:gene24841-57010_t